jgi:hypothetical protein
MQIDMDEMVDSEPMSALVLVSAKLVGFFVWKEQLIMQPI